MSSSPVCRSTWSSKVTESHDIHPAQETAPLDAVAIQDQLADVGEPEPAPAIDARGLVKHFGHDTQAVNGIDLRVERGEIFGLVGADGAGKSTLIRMLSTVLRPSKGDALIFGESVTERPGRIKPRIGYMSQRFSLYPDLTVMENLRFFADLRGVPRVEMRLRAARLLEFSGLEGFANRRAEHLSGGMKQKLALAVTLMHEPDLLFLDEPTTGVDPVSRREFWRIIAGLHRQGITVLVATPYMDEAERCSRVAFMDGGSVLFQDTPSGLKERVPGLLVEIASTDERAALEAVRDASGVLAATVQGELVRVITAHGGPSPADLAERVTMAGTTVSAALYGRMDMEATFAYLTQEARAAAAARQAVETAEEAAE